MSDTPAEIAARKFANDVAREIARKIEMDLGSAMWLVDLIDKRFAEQESERIRELEQRVEQAESGERGALNQLQGLEQSNKELLEALRKLWKHTPQIDNGYCAVCRCAYRFWERGQPGPCQDSRCLSHVVRAALSKHGGGR